MLDPVRLSVSGEPTGVPVLCSWSPVQRHADLADGTVIGTIRGAARIEETVDAMRNAPQNISFSDLRSVCVHFFGEPRQSGTSHAVFRTPWPGDPRVNIQKSKGGKAKSYQVRTGTEGSRQVERGAK